METKKQKYKNHKKKRAKNKNKNRELRKKRKENRNQFSALNLILGKWATLAVNVRLRTMPGWFDSYVIVQI